MMALGLLPADMLRKLYRDQIMDEDYKTRIRAFFEPRNGCRPMQVMMRDQQVNEAASVGADLGIQGLFTPE